MPLQCVPLHSNFPKAKEAKGITATMASERNVLLGLYVQVAVLLLCLVVLPPATSSICLIRCITFRLDRLHRGDRHGSPLLLLQLKSRVQTIKLFLTIPQLDYLLRMIRQCRHFWRSVQADVSSDVSKNYLYTV